MAIKSFHLKKHIWFLIITYIDERFELKMLETSYSELDYPLDGDNDYGKHAPLRTVPC